jgi:hypothetical protein|eukprot:COSAG06_NODE_2038_length_7765_cov_124.776285_7_plen_31_part_00
MQPTTQPPKLTRQQSNDVMIRPAETGVNVN